MRELSEGRLFSGKSNDLKPPPLFKHYIKQNVDTARGAEPETYIRTFKKKYGPNYDDFYGVHTKTVLDARRSPVYDSL